MNDLSGFLVNLACCLGVVAATFLGTWVIAVRRDLHRIVDVVWGLGAAIVAAVSFLLSAGSGDLGRRVLVTALTVVWGLRLAVHIYLRGRGKGEDRRYTELLDRAPGSPSAYVVRKVYLPQAAALWFVSVPVQAAEYAGRGLGVLAVVGTAVWLVGFGFEAVGDWQLTRFTADPSNNGTVLDHGLWRYTRHPNYFGDACVWWGLYLVSCAWWPGVATVLSPVAMTLTLARGTGKPMLEKTMQQRRPGYAEYVKRTSGFIPLPPKRSQ